MVKRTAVSKGGAHVLAFSASGPCEFSVLRRLDPANLPQNLARGRELFRLDSNCDRDLPIHFLKSRRAAAPDFVGFLRVLKDVQPIRERCAAYDVVPIGKRMGASA